MKSLHCLNIIILDEGGGGDVLGFKDFPNLNCLELAYDFFYIYYCGEKMFELIYLKILS